jgi:hypothetical protein
MKHAILLLTIVGISVTSLAASPWSERWSPEHTEKPDVIVLSAAYPNPFNPATTFSVTVKERQELVVEVFNLLGIRVQVLFDGVMESGETRAFTFDAGELPSGIYLYRVRGTSMTATRQMTLMK